MTNSNLEKEKSELARLEKESIEVVKKEDIMNAVMVLQDLKIIKEAADEAYDDAVKTAKAKIKEADKQFSGIYNQIDQIDSAMRTEIITFHDTHIDSKEVPGLSWRESKQVIIEDASKIPAEHMIPDMAKLTKLANAGVTNIPGTAIIIKSTPVIR